MAYTVSVIHKSVFGNKRVHVLSCVADATTQTVDTGLEHVDFFSVAPQSLTALPKVGVNAGAEGTSIAGHLGLSGVTSGDVFFLTVYGR